MSFSFIDKEMMFQKLKLPGSTVIWVKPRICTWITVLKSPTSFKLFHLTLCILVFSFINNMIILHTCRIVINPK